MDNLKAGRTTAPDRPPIPPVADEIVDKTLPFLPPIVADMVQVQRLIGGRPQDVYNMRSCDIDRTGEVWAYRPFTHKTEHKRKERVVAVGPRAQAILTPCLIDKQDTPEAFLFSPKDSIRLFRTEQRKNRKSKVQPSQQDRSKPGGGSRQAGDHYTKDSYNQAVERACQRAGVPKWTPNQLRHNAGTETAAKFSLEAAKEFLGHSSIATTEKFYVAPLPELAAKVAREIG